jgi:Antirepressor regulating drug resistance, predicted signal transduction N-terminal membrane component
MSQLLQSLFVDVFNMSLTGCYVILLVLAIRLLLKKAPKIFSYALWGVVLFRLLIPASFSSAASFLSIFHSGTGPVPQLPDLAGTEAVQQNPTSAVPPAHAANVPIVSQATGQEADLLHSLIPVFTWLWISGMAILLAYSVLAYLRLKRKTRTATRSEGNTYECDAIGSPCVIGLIKPKIYLPYGLSQSEKSYIVKHEQIHILRFDYLLRPLAFLVLCIHWFNPFAWIAFLLMGRDMEMSCDESVLKRMGPDIKVPYSHSLLSFAAGRRFPGSSPLTFGEQNADRRIKNILNYRRLPLWIAVVILICLALAGISLISDPKDARPADHNLPQQFSAQELTSLAGIWAESLKTRNGEPRYEIMSQKMKDHFIEEQKQRNDPWNFNIGVSSPWVKDYEITVKDDTAEILYHMTDSTRQIYDQKEILHFGRENEKTVVTEADQLLSDWERYNYRGSSAKEAMEAYRKALLESDYGMLLAMTPSQKLDPYGQLIWNTIKISDVKVTAEDVQHGRASYKLELTVQDPGNSAFEKGVWPRWLQLAKDSQGWYVEGLTTDSPGGDWGQSSVSRDPYFGNSQWVEGTYRFDCLAYLSQLSSSSFDYAENAMKGALFIIGTDRFEIDYPDKDDYVLKNPVYKMTQMTDDMVRSFEKSTMNQVSISKYKVKYRYDIYTNDNKKTNFSFYLMDHELWLVSYSDNTADGSEVTMFIWKLK